MTMSIVGGLLKTAVQLSKEDERKQMVQFAGLGGVAYPSVQAVGNLIQSGKVIPPPADPKRWLASQVLKGALVGGAIPAARHFIGRGNIEEAKSRIRAEKEMKSLIPGGALEVQKAVQQLPMAASTSEDFPSVKTGASKIMARLSGNLKVRKGRRPMRVETLLKKGSVKEGSWEGFLKSLGRRSPDQLHRMGMAAIKGMRKPKGFDVMDAIADAKDLATRNQFAKQHADDIAAIHKRTAEGIKEAPEKARQSAEALFGPLLKKGSQSGADLRLPVMGGTKFPTGDSLSQAKATLKEHQNVAKPKMVQPKVQPVQGVPMPKFSSVDPLVEYLRKTAQKSKVDSEGKLGDNEGDMKTSPEEQTRVDACPFASQRGGDKTLGEWRSQLNEMFSHKEGITKKYLDKESVAKGPK